jgi:hypothetical protein
LSLDSFHFAAYSHVGFNAENSCWL